MSGLNKLIVLWVALYGLHSQVALAQSLPQTREALVSALQSYLSDYKNSPENQKKLAAEKAPGLDLEALMSAQDQSELDTLSRLLDSSIGEHAKHGWTSEDLQARLSALSNGARWSDRIRVKLGLASDRLRGSDAATYAELVAWLVARYVEQPEDRDAIYALLKKVSASVAPEVRARNRDAEVLAERVMAGTSTALTVIFLIESGPSIYQFGKKLSSMSAAGLRNLLNRLGSREVAAAVQEEGLVLSQAARDRALARAEHAAEELGEQVVGGAAAAGRGAAEGRSALEPMSERRSIARQMKDLARQTAVGLVVGGLPAGLATLDEQSEAAKVDPLAVLKIFQTFIFIDIEAEAAKRAASLQAQAETLSKSGTPAARKQARAELASGQKRLAELKSQLAHLDAHASEFKGVVAYPKVAAQLRAYAQRSRASKLLRSEEDQMSAFLTASRDLQERVNAADGRIRAEAQARGIASYAPLAASLEASTTQVAAFELALQALASATR